MRPESVTCGYKTLIIAKICFHSKRMVLHVPPLHYE